MGADHPLLWSIAAMIARPSPRLDLPVEADRARPVNPAWAVSGPSGPLHVPRDPTSPQPASPHTSKGFGVPGFRRGPMSRGPRRSIEVVGCGGLG